MNPPPEQHDHLKKAFVEFREGNQKNPAAGEFKEYYINVYIRKYDINLGKEAPRKWDWQRIVKNLNEGP